MRTSLLSILILLLSVLPVAAADYWPDDATRTYVFGEGAERIQLVVDPQGGGAVEMRWLSATCDISWSGTLAPDGTLEVDAASFLCVEVIEPVLELDFDPGSLLFDPTKVGGAIQAFDDTTEEYTISVRIGAPRLIDFDGGSVEAVLFELGVQDGSLANPVVVADLSVTQGPLRVNDRERTQVLDGIVRDAVRTWGGIKARF